jgi:DNA processing protein
MPMIGPVTFGVVSGSSVDAAAEPGCGLMKVEEAKTAERIAASRDKFDSGAELELAAKLGVWIVHLEDPRYPPALRQIYDPPPVLYIKGTLDRADNLAIGIVGCRRCSLYGQEQSSRLAHLLAAAGFTIVSGMARGIDTAAHTGALAAEGRTLAVQGCGLSRVFPPENAKLFELISASGAVAERCRMKVAGEFPPRNRIIAGLSLGTIVVEAGPRSGALITAQAALESNREVMAVPGKVDSPLSQGPHRLIKEGAKLIETVEDVMEALGYIGDQLKDHTALTAQETTEKVEMPLLETTKFNLKGHEKTIYDALGKDPLHIDQLIATRFLSAEAVNAGVYPSVSSDQATARQPLHKTLSNGWHDTSVQMHFSCHK